MPRKSNIALLAFSTIFALLLSEMLLRWLAPLHEFNHHRLYCEYDPLLGWRKIPNSAGDHHTDEYQVTEHINSMGLRGPEYPLQKSPDRRRILVLGDSFAEGYTVNFDELFSEVLVDSLNRKCPDEKIEIINAGTGGYSTDQELLYFENEGVRFQPDFTILLFCTNDPWYNAQDSYWRGFKPLFVYEADSLRLSNVPVPTMSSRSIRRKVKDWLLQNSLIVRRIKNAKDQLKYASNQQIVPDEWKIYQSELSPEMAVTWQTTAALLQRLHQQTQAADSELLVFYIPEKVEVYPADWLAFLSTYSLDEQFFDKENPRRRLTAICDSLQIPLLDPAAAFVKMARADASKYLYYENDWHWNAAGNRLAGVLLSDWFECGEGGMSSDATIPPDKGDGY